MASVSQALEKMWLFSVPLHPMLILWKHICFWNFRNIYVSGISETSGRKYISTIP